MKDYLRLGIEELGKLLQGELRSQVSIQVKGLSVKEAIGSPQRQDYPIQKGKEILIQADFQGFKGQAFTTHPKEFVGELREVFQMDSSQAYSRALQVATLNAVTSYLGVCEKSIHCKDEEPEECGSWIAEQLQGQKGKISMIGLNPAILQKLLEAGLQVRCSDLDPDWIGKHKFGITIEDGSKVNDELLETGDFVLFTGSTICNDSFDKIMDAITTGGKDYAIFGTTAAGICGLMELHRFCPCAKTLASVTAIDN